MTRPAATAPRRVRDKKRTPPRRPTAHVEYQPAGLDGWGRRVREHYHAITDQTVRIGGLTRHSGDAVCGSAGPWMEIPDGLVPALVTCRACQHITARYHISITPDAP
jgi:hypothetical protein